MDVNRTITQGLGLAAMETMAIALVGAPTAYAAPSRSASATVVRGVLTITGSNAGDSIAID